MTDLSHRLPSSSGANAKSGIEHANVKLKQQCPLCRNGTALERSLYDDRYGYAGRFQLRRCMKCGHRHVDAQMSDQQIGGLYTRYYPRASFEPEKWSPACEAPAGVTWWRGLAASAYRWVPRNVRVLDIGCGLCESLGYHLARGCEAYGVEVDANVSQIAKRHQLNVHCGQFDAALYEPASFDVVTLDQVVEHLTNPVQTLAAISRILKSGGRLIISTPNPDGWGSRVFGARWIHWHVPYHLHFFSGRSMAMTAALTGYSVERRAVVTNSSWLHFQWHHLIDYPAEGQPSNFWSGKGHQSLSRRWTSRLLSLADRVGINATLTRLFDLLGCGDNCIYVLRKAEEQCCTS